MLATWDNNSGLQIQKIHFQGSSNYYYEPDFQGLQEQKIEEKCVFIQTGKPSSCIT